MVREINHWKYYRREPEQEHRWKAGAREFQQPARRTARIVGARQVIKTQARTKTGVGIQE